MNAPCACLLMALAFVGADAEAHPPGPTAPQTDAPSPLRCDSDRQIAPRHCVIEGPNKPRVDEAESTQDCIARCAMDDASIDGMSRQVIDWHAVPPQGDVGAFGLRGLGCTDGAGRTSGTRALLSPRPGMVEGAAGPDPDWPG